MQTWLCCQLGAREHYAVPRALQLDGLLTELITDLWMRRAGRFYPGLAGARIAAPNLAALRFELKASFARENGWKLISQRNEWFQRQAIAQLKRTANGSHTIFAYSYAAGEIFEFARARGWARSIPGRPRNESYPIKQLRKSTGTTGAANARLQIASSLIRSGPEMDC